MDEIVRSEAMLQLRGKIYAKDLIFLKMWFAVDSEQG